MNTLQLLHRHIDLHLSNRQTPHVNPWVSHVSANVLVNTHTTYWPIHGLFLVSMLVNTWSILLPCIDIFICIQCHHWGKRSVWTNYLRGHKFIKNIARQDRQTFATGQSVFKTAALTTEMTKIEYTANITPEEEYATHQYSIGQMLMAYWAICWLIISQNTDKHYQSAYTLIWEWRADNLSVDISPNTQLTYVNVHWPIVAFCLSINCACI